MDAWLNSHPIVWILIIFFLFGYGAWDTLKSFRRGRAIRENIDKMKREADKNSRGEISKI